MTSGASQARRLVLSAAEYVALTTAAGSEPSEGFTTKSVTAEESAAGAVALVGRGVLIEAGSGTYRPVESVAVNLALLIGPTVLIQVEVSAGERGLRSMFAVSGSLGASLLTVVDGGVELSMFPATALGLELIRAVPAPERVSAGRSRNVVAALSGEDSDDASLAGRLPLAALASGLELIRGAQVPEQVSAGRSRNVVAALSGEDSDDASLAGRPCPDPTMVVTAEQAELAEQINWHTTGLLSCLVTGRVGEGLVVGEVVWLATRTGWLGVRPDPDRDGARMVVVGPVDRAALGTWVAPYVAEILEAAR